MTGEFASDREYLEIILRKIAVCKTYKPRFGQGNADLTLAQFQELYRRDVFYSWFGLDTPHVYSAHRAAGGITSVYRQNGRTRYQQAVMPSELFRLMQE